MLKPKDTVAFLNKLESKGFSNDHIRLIHFKKSETVTSHLNYAKGIHSFNINSRNMVVCQRLKFIVKHIGAVNDKDSFTVLAKVAAKEFPISK